MTKSILGSPGPGYRRLLSASFVVLLAMAIWIGLRSRRPAAVVRAPGFRDSMPESGIDFHMSFLPNEQGETYFATTAMGGLRKFRTRPAWKRFGLEVLPSATSTTTDTRMPSSQRV
jgi:hypothetical protein